jgi:hypothetical protein
MEINLKKLGEQQVESTTGQKKMRLSENASSMVFQLFTKNVYSNPIGTVVREITSNCFDSHVEAKVNAPVLIKKFVDPQTETIYMSFIDYGVGMSPDRVENIYGVYFESTKRVDNTQIGGFGIGGKTPLAYKRSTGNGEGEYDNSFYVITNFDGTRYYYCIYEGAESPVISLLHSEPTTDGNGTEVRIPILAKDQDSFAKELVKQLYYFENIVFEGFDDDYRYGDTLMNEYQIVRGKSFLFRGSAYSDYAHICLGRVAYPIDFGVLGLSSSDYRLPVAIKLEVGAIGVTVSRESLDYSEATIKLLKSKLEDVKNEIKDLITKQYNDVQTLEQYFNMKTNFGKLMFSNGSSINVGSIIKQADIVPINFKYGFMKMPNDKQLFKFFFDTKTYGKKAKRNRYSSNTSFDGGYEAIQHQNSNLYYIDGEFNRRIVKQAYLKSIHSTYFIVEKRRVDSNFMRSEIADLFNVHLDAVCDDNGKPVEYVQSLLDMQEEYFTIVQRYASDYDKIEIPEDFIASRKRGAGLTKEIRNTTIPVKFIGGGYRSKSRVKLDKLFGFKSTIFYGTEEDEMVMRDIASIFKTLFPKTNIVSFYDDYYHTFDSRSGLKNMNSIMFILVAKNNIKYMEYCKHALKPSDFFNKFLKRKTDEVLQYFQTYKLIEKFGTIEELYKSMDFVKISPEWGMKINDLKASIAMIPNSKSDAIGNIESLLSKYFDLSSTMTADQIKIDEQIDEILLLQTMNTDILKYIDMPHYFNANDEILVNILKKVMVLA